MRGVGVVTGGIHDWRCYGPPMAKSDTGQWEAALEGFTKESFEADGKRRDIYRAGQRPRRHRHQRNARHHPAGGRIRAEGGGRRLHRGDAPHLRRSRAAGLSGATSLESIGPACVSREFSAFALKKTSPITVWLRKLAAAEHERCGGPGVGVVGMCFTGGFALAMMVDDIVLAPVLSQPSLPFPLSKKHKADIGISDADLARVKERTAAGRLPPRPAVQQRPVLLRGALRHLAA